MKRYANVLAAVLVLASCSGTAIAQDSWKGTAGLLHIQDASTVGRGRLLFTLGTTYYSRRDITLTSGPLSLWKVDTLNSPPVDYHFFLSRAQLTLGLSDYIELAVGLNVRNWIMRVNEDEVDEVADQAATAEDRILIKEFETRTRGGVGDMDIMLKICPPIPTDYLGLGLLGYASFPTGNKDRGFTTNQTDFGFKGLFTFNFTDVENFIPTKLHCNVGYRFNKNEEEGYGIIHFNNPDSSGFYPDAYPYVPEGESNNFNDVFELGTGIEFVVKNTSLFLEFNWNQFKNADFAEDDLTYEGYRNKSVFMLTPGISAVSENGVGVLLGADFNLNSDDDPPIINPPDWEVYFMLSIGAFVMPQDADDDGIEDKVDRCPNEPEDFDGFEDNDGCPDMDNDKDGIGDGTDACPDLAEDFDGFEDEDGCPDLDNDGDGIPDVEDRCPNEPEDFDGFEDSDGCPDVLQDSDNDGVPDDMDKCPLKAEDIDGFQDEDGCPDLDNDLDGILDADDQCPNEPETFNAYLDEDGCPDERPIEEKFILRGINFESGSAALTPDSYAILDQVVRSLMAYPEVRVEIRGYTDSVGGDEYNLGLSQRRADAVKQYLVNSGIAGDRIVSRGYGEADPIAPNSTASGRSENRRIEFHRLL